MANIQDYGDLHRAVLQTLMGHGTIEKKPLEKITEKICGKLDVEPVNDLDELISKINEKIAPFDQKITSYEYGLSKADYYVFHSTTKTSMSQFQNSYNADEIELFKNILKRISENEDLNIAPRDVLNLSTASSSKINKLRAQKLLDIWIQYHYFYKHSDNQIYLGAKVLTEFREMLQNMELDYLKSCLLCESIAIWGDRCVSCHTIYHSSCLRKFLSRSDICPSCKEKWEVADAN